MFMLKLYFFKLGFDVCCLVVAYWAHCYFSILKIKKYLTNWNQLPAKVNLFVFAFETKTLKKKKNQSFHIYLL